MKKFLSLVLALVMAMSLVTVSAGAKDFTDSDSISGEDYAEAIDVMSALEIIDGYEGGAFQPQGTLTRGAAAKIIACMMLGKTTAESLGSQAAPFKDVPAGSTFAGYIAYCVEAGIIDGYADGTFRPSNKLTGFAFLKMLLTAMGYDSAVEHFTGTNWTVNVARRAIENGLTDGNDDFVGTDLATREEACLYAVNTIKATLVEYENKGSSIVINGVEISQGASAPKVVTSVNKEQATSINAEKYITGATGQQDTYTVEFGEKYMPKLSLKGDTDAFYRPVHVWDYKGVKIGTYTDDADLEYNKKVASDTIYDDLGLTSAVEATVYMDGVVVDHDSIANGDQGFLVQNNNTKKTGDTGVLTQVWKGGRWDNGKWITTVTITEMHYYAGDVVSKTAATKNKDAYVTVVARGEKGYLGGTFTTEDFAVDDVVYYNYSKKAGDTGVKYLTVAETATGTLTSYTTGDSATVGGTKYDYSCTIANEAANAAINKDVTVVLDPFGYALDIDGANAESYAVVLGVNDQGDLRTEAKLMFADGKVEIVNTSSDYAGVVSLGDIVAYEIKSNDRYALNKKVDSFNATVSITNGGYTFTANGTTYFANGETVFLVKTVDANGNAMYNAYEGIKNVPTITLKNANTFAVYCKNSYNQPATVVYVDASGATVLNPSSDVIFVKGNDKNVSYTTGIGSYYLFDAVVNGEVKEIMADSKYGMNKGVYGLYDGVSYDANNVATLYKSDNVIEGTGAYKQKNDVLGTMLSNGSFKYYGVTSDCFVVVVTEDDAEFVTGLTAASVVEDTNDKVFFKLNNSNQITSAYVVKVPSGEIASSFSVGPVTGLTFSYLGGADYTALGKVPAGVTVTVKASANVNVTSTTLTLTPVEGGYTFVMPARNVVASDFAVNAKQGEVTFTNAGTFNITIPGYTVEANKVTLPYGTYTATFEKSNYAPATVTFTVDEATETVADPEYVELTIAADQDSSGTGVNGVKIMSFNVNNKMVTHVVPGENGVEVVVTLDCSNLSKNVQLKAGSEVIAVVAAGAATQNFTCTVTAATEFSLVTVA